MLRGTLERESLALAVVGLPDQPTRLAWLAAQLPTWTGSGIIYCLTVAATELVRDHLRAAGLEVAAYSGQTDPAERLQAEDDLINNRIKALVATSALGMGFDKPDLGFVVHLGAPPSPIAYYQQVGRAGRGVDRAVAVLLPAREDRDIWDYFGSLAFPAETQVRRTLDALADAGRPQSIAALETQVDLKRSRLEMMLKVLDVDGAVRRVQGGWESTGRPWAYDADRYQRVAQARHAEQDAMLRYQRTDECRMRFLREQLDDPQAGGIPVCGRCDNCTGTPMSAAVDESAVQAAKDLLDIPGVLVPPRAMWPTGMKGMGIALTGKIAEADRAEMGRAIGRLDSIGWGNALRDLLRGDDAETPVPLRHAAAEVLRAWPEASDVDGVVGVGSQGRPQLLGHLAPGLARMLKVPFFGWFEPLPGRGPESAEVNSAQRLRAVAGRHRLSDPPAVAGKTVLLVDDLTSSGWTLTVLSRELRQAGALRVLPFVLAVG